MTAILILFGKYNTNSQKPVKIIITGLLNQHFIVRNILKLLYLSKILTFPISNLITKTYILNQEMFDAIIENDSGNILPRKNFTADSIMALPDASMKKKPEKARIQYSNIEYISNAKKKNSDIILAFHQSVL